MVHGRLKEKFSRKRFLLILDDVWNRKQNEWEALKAPLQLGSQGSKIVVTTCDMKVALVVG
uniref:Disease resistance protein RGA3 n=1 Tax=Cajanus cajan TaxID=3821 RepID=A0A151QWW6_CAJCA|nr:Putative disease resistance protein RGA3 [Cajanus cajan]